jgi:hypothetical protein
MILFGPDYTDCADERYLWNQSPPGRKDPPRAGLIPKAPAPTVGGGLDRRCSGVCCHNLGEGSVSLIWAKGSVHDSCLGHMFGLLASDLGRPGAFRLKLLATFQHFLKDLFEFFKGPNRCRFLKEHL